MSAPVREVGDSEPPRDKRSKNERSNNAVRSPLAPAPEQIPEIVQHLCISSAPDFDYASVSFSVAAFLRGQATRIRQYTRKSIIQIGKDLAAAKHYLSHGQFVRWVEAEVGIPARTAQGYMRAAKWASGKSATVGHLPPSLLYVLSASNTPKEFVEEIVNRAEAGELIVLSRVRAGLRALRDAKRRARIDGCTADVPVMHNHDFDQYRMMSNGEAALMEAVRILVGALTGSDLARIRQIMMSNEVLHHPDLSKNIKIAFSTLPDRNGHRKGVRQEGVAGGRKDPDFWNVFEDRDDRVIGGNTDKDRDLSGEALSQG